MSVISKHNKYHRFKKDGKQYYVHRVVMEKKIGRKLISGEIVHHIDGDTTNNKPNNLEIMDKLNHCKHHGEKKRVEPIKLNCYHCNSKFTRVARRYRYDIKRGKTDFFCSIKCFRLSQLGYKYTNSNIDSIDKIIIKHLNNDLTGYAIWKKQFVKLSRKGVYDRINRMKNMKLLALPNTAMPHYGGHTPG